MVQVLGAGQKEKLEKVDIPFALFSEKTRITPIRLAQKTEDRSYKTILEELPKPGTTGGEQCRKIDINPLYDIRASQEGGSETGYQRGRDGNR